jgi:hypothetical protein
LRVRGSGEARKSAGLVNALSGDAPATDGEPDAHMSPLTPATQEISADIDGRWKGALVSLLNGGIKPD